MPTEENDITLPESGIPDPQAAANPAPQQETAAADASSDGQATESLPTLEERLRLAEASAAEHQDAWLRARAELENLRRRAHEDAAKAGKFAIEKFAGELLAVKDSLEAALASDSQNLEALRAGVELTLKQLQAAFEKSHLHEIYPLDEKFDPHRHQAISQVEADGEPNRVIQVLQKGYALHERIIRPALVVVSKPPATPAA